MKSNWESNKEILEKLRLLINKYPEQRFCQILCNYVLDDKYTWSENVISNIKVLGDPFYIENKVILDKINNRL